MSLDFDSALDGIDASRRDLLHRLVTESAFVAPAVSTFSMSGISRAYAGIIGASNINSTG